VAPFAYTEAEDEIIRTMCSQVPRAELARMVGRPEHSVGKRITRLGLREAARPMSIQGQGLRDGNLVKGWKDWELELLRDPEVPLTEIAARTGRTRQAVRHKASRMGLVNIRTYWLRGSDHPNWVGGQSPSERTWRGQTWPEIRRFVLDRDGYACQDCKMFVPSATGLVVHHVIPYRLRPINDPEWLATLCVTDHLKRPEHWWKSIPPEIEDQIAALE